MQDFHQLITLCKQRDTKAEYALYRECYAILKPICYRYVKSEDDAADLMNRGFLKILNSLETYDETKPFEHWIKTILVNTIIDKFRKDKRERTLIIDTDMVTREQGQGVDWNTAESKLAESDYLKAVQKLPELNRTVFNMYVFEQLEHKEIAAKLNISEGTSRWYLSTTRGMLRKKITQLMSNLKPILI